jgi:hypothetical protein
MEPATINPTMNAHDMQRHFEELRRASELKLQYAHIESQVADLAVQNRSRETHIVVLVLQNQAQKPARATKCATKTE